MTHQLPQLLPHCNYTHFCADCRDREKGQEFRRGVLERQGIEGVEVDFACPKDKPWNGQLLRDTKQLPAQGLGDTIAKITKAVGIKPHGVTAATDEEAHKAVERGEVCHTCEHLGEKGVRLTVESKRGIEPIFRVHCKLRSSCGGGLSLVRGKCKAGKW